MRNIHIWEKHQLVASHMPLTGDLAHNPGMCPDQESNRWPLSLWDDIQRTEPYQSGFKSDFLIKGKKLLAKICLNSTEVCKEIISSPCPSPKSLIPYWGNNSSKNVTVTGYIIFHCTVALFIKSPIIHCTSSLLHVFLFFVFINNAATSTPPPKKNPLFPRGKVKWSS